MNENLKLIKKFLKIYKNRLPKTEKTKAKQIIKKIEEETKEVNHLPYKTSIDYETIKKLIHKQKKDKNTKDYESYEKPHEIMIRVDYLLRIPLNIIKKMGITGRQMLDVYSLNDMIIITKPFRPNNAEEIMVEFENLAIALNLIRARKLILDAKGKKIVIKNFKKGLLAELRSKGYVGKTYLP